MVYPMFFVYCGFDSSEEQDESLSDWRSSCTPWHISCEMAGVFVHFAAWTHSGRRVDTRKGIENSVPVRSRNYLFGHGQCINNNRTRDHLKHHADAGDYAVTSYWFHATYDVADPSDTTVALCSIKPRSSRANCNSGW